MRINRFALPGLLALAVTGCGKEQAPVTPAPAPGAPAPAAVKLTDLDAVKSSKSPYRIALIVKTRNNPFFRPMISEFEKTVKELGCVPDVQAPPQEMDYEKQMALVQEEVSRGVRAICIAPADSKGIVPALVAASKKGVLVINLDNRVDRGAATSLGLSLTGYVGADNLAGGRLAGEAMLAKVKAGADVAILEGIRGADNAEARRKGFSEAVQGKLKVVASESAEWDTEKAYQKTQNILAAHKGLAGIFCANDKMAVGAMKAIAESGQKGKITVVGYDNIPDVKAALTSGELAATIEQRPDLMGRYGARMAVGVLNGEVPAGGDIVVPLETVTK
jgi:ribose transport system substrate-binding protein